MKVPTVRNRPVPRRLVAALMTLGVVSAPGAALAQVLPGMPPARPARDVQSFGLPDLARGWENFTNGWFMLDMAIVLALSAGLGAVIAYHPLIRSKAASVEELEQPKTFIMYAIVGALIALVVQVNDMMALVVFGIGGLLRFRTNVGPAKDTGRVILAVIVGICCGVKLIVVAVFATAFGWAILWYLESQDYGRMQVKGVGRDVIPRAAEAYRRLLVMAGCKILGEKKKFTKGTITFVFTAPRRLDREELEQRFLVAVPEDIRGSVDWDIS